MWKRLSLGTWLTTTQVLLAVAVRMNPGINRWPRDVLAEDLLYATFFGQLALLAAWICWGHARLWVRWAGTGVGWLFWAVLFRSFDATDMTEAAVLSTVFSVPVIAVLYAARFSGYRVLESSCAIVGSKANQFWIGHLMGATAFAAVVVALIRTRNLEWMREAESLTVIATISIISIISITLTLMSPRPAIWLLAIVSLGASGGAVHAMHFWTSSVPDSPFIFGLFQSVTILAATIPLRLIGYRLMRVAGAGTRPTISQSIQEIA